MSERLRLVREQIKDCHLEIERLRAGTVSRDAVNEVAREVFRVCARELERMLADAPAVLMANRNSPLVAFDLHIRERLSALSELPKPKYQPLRSKRRNSAAKNGDL